MIKEILNTMIDLSLEAGIAIMDIYATDFNVEYKSDNSPLTKADLAANRVIVDGLLKKYPNYGILSEESKDDKTRLEKDYIFVIDPIDGTKEFVKKNDDFTVNIGLVDKDTVILGVVYAPALNILYYGGKDIQATKCNVIDYKLVSKENIHVSNNTNDLIILASKSHSSEKEQNLIKNNQDKIKEVKYIGSSLKGCLVAEASADIYYKYGVTNEWDTCAMQAIIESAGGILREMDHSIMKYNRINTKNLKGFYIVNKKENIL